MTTAEFIAAVTPLRDGEREPWNAAIQAAWKLASETNDGELRKAAVSEYEDFLYRWDAVAYKR